MGTQHELHFAVVLAAVVGIPFVVGFLSADRRRAFLWCLLLSITTPAALWAMRGLTPTLDGISLGCALSVAITSLTGYATRSALRPGSVR